jgi:hypothetical protein
MIINAEDYRLVPIDGFDARRGYARWTLPGVGTGASEGGALANADLWTDRQGRLVTRFESRGYTLHFEIRVVSGRRITQQMETDVSDFLWAMLSTWAAEGVDDDLECDDVIYDD